MSWRRLLSPILEASANLTESGHRRKLRLTSLLMCGVGLQTEVNLQIFAILWLSQNSIRRLRERASFPCRPNSAEINPASISSMRFVLKYRCRPDPRSTNIQSIWAYSLRPNSSNITSHRRIERSDDNGELSSRVAVQYPNYYIQELVKAAKECEPY